MFHFLYEILVVLATILYLFYQYAMPKLFYGYRPPQALNFFSSAITFIDLLATVRGVSSCTITPVCVILVMFLPTKEY